MKVSTEIDNNFGYEKITQLVDNIPLIVQIFIFYFLMVDILEMWQGLFCHSFWIYHDTFFYLNDIFSVHKKSSTVLDG